MELVITLNQDELKLEIRQKGRVIDPERGREGTQRASASYGVDFETAKYYHDLSDVLISCLDKLLIRTSIDIKSLKGYKIQGNLGTDSTSYKIASAFVEGLKI